MPCPEVDIRLIAQRALLSFVTRGLRAVSVEKRGDVIKWRCIFESEAAKEAEWTELSCAATEVIAEYSEPTTIDEEYWVVEPNHAPGGPLNNMQHLEHLVYLRHEESTHPPGKGDTARRL